MKEQTITTYVAFDGTEFDEREYCEKYESFLNEYLTDNKTKMKESYNEYDRAKKYLASLTDDFSLKYGMTPDEYSKMSENELDKRLYEVKDTKSESSDEVKEITPDKSESANEYFKCSDDDSPKTTDDELDTYARLLSDIFGGHWSARKVK